MTARFTSDGWRDERIDALEQLGRNAQHFGDLSEADDARAGRATTRAWLAVALLCALALVAGHAATIWMTAHVAARLEAGE